jgi:hypothetical protein
VEEYIAWKSALIHLPLAVGLQLLRGALMSLLLELVDLIFLERKMSAAGLTCGRGEGTHALGLDLAVNEGTDKAGHELLGLLVRLRLAFVFAVLLVGLGSLLTTLEHMLKGKSTKANLVRGGASDGLVRERGLVAALLLLLEVVVRDALARIGLVEPSCARAGVSGDSDRSGWEDGPMMIRSREGVSGCAMWW